jgi:MFS superfamily sulfate permease-like transporter
LTKRFLDEDGAAVSIQTGVSELVKILIVVILLITDQEELCFRQEKISFGSFWANNPNQCNIQLLERFIFQTMKTTSQNSFSEGLAQNWRSDLLSGFMVFLLALPLSLGIAKASGFPAAMGVLTAMVGGLVTSFFRVAPLAIKGPAAGLITICSGAFLEFGGEQAWPMVTAAVMVAGALQIFLAGARWGSLSDFFPATVVHGMLSSIGMIIIAKQFPVLMGIAAGIVLKFVLHWIRGVQWSQFFKADGRFESASGVFYIKGPAIFSNLLSFKKQINKHQHVAPLVLDFGDCSFVDHTFLEFIYRLKRERNQVSKPLHIQNLEQMQAVSGYKTSARRRFKNQNS